MMMHDKQRSALASPAVAGAPMLMAVAGLGSAVVTPTSFVLAAGQCLAIRGHSGAGKTRLLRLLADLDDGVGEVYLDGVARSAISAPAWRAQVVYQSAEPAWWHNSVLAHFTAAQTAAAIVLAEQLALPEERLHAEIGLLSTGERQRAALIRSLLTQPKVLLLDEPTSALDQDNVQRVEQLLQAQLAQGLAIVLVTHAQQQAARLAQQSIEVIRRQP